MAVGTSPHKAAHTTKGRCKGTGTPPKTKQWEFQRECHTWPEEARVMNRRVLLVDGGQKSACRAKRVTAHTAPVLEVIPA